MFVTMLYHTVVTLTKWAALCYIFEMYLYVLQLYDEMFKL